MMLFPLIAFLIPLLGTLLALGLAVFVLSRNWRAWTNRWLAMGLSAISMYQGLMLAAVVIRPIKWPLFLIQLALAIAMAIPPTWLAFCSAFGGSNGGSRLFRRRPLLVCLTVLVPLAGLLLAMGYVVRPIRLEPAGPILAGVDEWGKVYFSVFLIGLAVVLLHLENLYRGAERFTRWKIKFLVVGIFVAFACQIVAASYALLYGLIHPLHPFFSALGFLLGNGMIAFSLVRHRLLDVDIFVSRYVIYRSLTLALVGGYLLSLGVVAEVFRRLNVALDLLTGTFLAILGAAALSLFLLSEDVRRKAQSFLHSHFYKNKYDYRLEWMEFTRRLSRASTIPEIAAQTVNRLLEVMWVRQAAMYTVAECPKRLILTYQREYSSLPATLELPEGMVETLQVPPKAIATDRGQNDASDLRGRIADALFGKTAVGCLVPVAALDTLAGLLVVGPELSGRPFGVDDRDLLAAVAAQAGALMVNARLAQEVSEGRELQILAQLSAFVAHDLKNAVSMLSMLAENAKLHMNKPAFQADAIRTLSEVTAKMRKLLATLSTPDSRTGAKTQPISLAPTVEAWMQELRLQIPSRIRVETRLERTSGLEVVPEQLRSVLHNLVLNAIDAIPSGGMILVETLQENGQAVLAVTDTGRGMTQDFIQRRLFRPFQTTKTHGLGIGLYQSRCIVQAFGGTLTAESREGEGTRITVRLPVVSTSLTEDSSKIQHSRLERDDSIPRLRT